MEGTDSNNLLPKQPFNNLAISMSGGGYRATSFHLGTLSYLSTVDWLDTALLDRVRIISTVSGGTFTGVNYATTLKNGGTIRDTYRSLHNFMSNADLIKDAMACLADDKYWNGSKQRTLINACSIVYYEQLEPAHFELLWREEPKIHIKELCFNATEFNFAIPFRFQKSEPSKGRNGGYTNGFVGNNFIRVPLDCAKEVRMADVIAASSCFPLGFEPINFPDDFIDDKAVYLKDRTLLPNENYKGDPISYPVGLMDGGIDDNQGIDSVWWAEKRMGNYAEENEQFASQDVKAIDLYIISDVSSPYMDSFIRSEKTDIPVIGNLSFNKLKIIGWISFILGVGLFIVPFFVQSTWISVACAALGTLAILFAFITRTLSKGFVGLTKKFGVPEYFVKRLKNFDTLNFNTYANLIINRGKSAKTMVSDVFMKQIRRSNYRKIYSDDGWRPRLMMNAVYELSPTEVKKRRTDSQGNISRELNNPSAELKDVAHKARNMGTTLWFTADELSEKGNMLNSLIACGQFTICFNLLEYIEKVVKGDTYKEAYDGYDDKLKADINDLYSRLMIDWKKFNDDPYWMVNEWNASELTK